MTEEALRVRVLVVDDHPIFRRGLRAHFEDTDVVVVGECANGADAVAAARELRPSVVLMDLHLPRRAGDEPTDCGTEVLREIREHVPNAVVVVLSMYEEPERAREVLRAGAMGYLLKDQKNIAQAVRTAAEGTVVVDDRLKESLVARPEWQSNGEIPFGLTLSEVRATALLARGLTNQQIATELQLSKKTVDNRISTIQRKLAAATREDAARIARERGIDGKN